MIGVDVLVIVTGDHVTGAAMIFSACVRGAGLMAGRLGNAVDVFLNRNMVQAVVAAAVIILATQILWRMLVRKRMRTMRISSIRRLVRATGLVGSVHGQIELPSQLHDAAKMVKLLQ